MSTDMKNFVTSIKSGKARAIAYNDGDVFFTKLKPEWIAQNWRLPSFDFGGILLPQNPQYMGEDVINELSRRYFDAHPEDAIKLPYKECIFINRGELPTGPSTTFTCCRTLADGSINIVEFEQDSVNPLTRLSAEFTFNKFNDSRVHCVVNGEIMLHQLALINIDGARINSMLPWFLAMLFPDAPTEKTEVQHPGQTYRIAKGKPTLPNTVVIRFNKTKSASQFGSERGSPKLPHMRRGHWRAYRSGKRRFIAEMKIKGGTDANREYVVKP